ncbi:prepilin-type N-terminal cleavage/methylation domain-containing protein [Caulobacter sp. NIBR1757]|uniref:prepilin-type N-terminal cleavage/methylation domain-containing protein n=1 Tax=Caulobacter sp. NIBR1757 TaxID=3016000 RepID=UPI0022F00685|nr:prepilin-type N-terminal cleavage/methylation domain-containing protein [Caulobacter sp. NIBR1757]
MESHGNPHLFKRRSRWMGGLPDRGSRDGGSQTAPSVDPSLLPRDHPVTNARRRRTGFTLTEMLVALLVLGLAMAAIAQATRVQAGLSKRVLSATDKVSRARAVDSFLRHALGAGPYSGATSSVEPSARGGESLLVFACAEAASCTLQITDHPRPRLILAGPETRVISLPRAGLSFRYLTADQPPARHYPAPGSASGLLGIAIVSDYGERIAATNFSAQQASDCAYDDSNHRCFPRTSQTPQ